MEDFRPEDDGRLSLKNAALEADVLKTVAALIVNKNIKKIHRETLKYTPASFQEFDNYWQTLIRKHLGNIPPDALTAELEQSNYLEQSFFDFLIGTQKLYYQNTITINRKRDMHPDDLKSKEIYERANEILSKKRNILKLIELVINFYFTDKEWRLGVTNYE